MNTATRLRIVAETLATHARHRVALDSHACGRLGAALSLLANDIDATDPPPIDIPPVPADAVHIPCNAVLVKLERFRREI